MTQKKILISGATGNVGTQLIKRLAALDIPFKALVRNCDNSALLKSLFVSFVTMPMLKPKSKNCA